MIWVDGKIVADDALKISVLDRTFEHGLGLFETLRTWNGHATLLDRHRARMIRSAGELKLPINPAALPDAGAVADLLRADGVVGDAMLRITLSGGLSDGGGSVVWMRSAPLPLPGRVGGAIIDSFWDVDADDPLMKHKCLNYWGRRLAHEAARASGSDEGLSLSRDRRIWEGSRTNLFLVVGPMVTTPRTDGPIVPGIMRELVLERGHEIGLEVRDQGEFSSGILTMVQEAFLTNSVRGIVPIRRIGSRKFRVPGPLTTRLWDDVRAWLERGGTP